MTRPSPSEFAHLWALDPGIIYLNHGSFGACTKYILEKRQDYLHMLDAQPMNFLIRDYEQRFDTARRRVAKFAGADPGNVVFVANATGAVNVVLRSLTFDPGDEILFTNHIYGACRKVIEYVCRKTGAIPVEAVYDIRLDHPGQITEAILAKASSKTKVALIDHITSATALLQPVEEIVRELDRRGIDTLVDGAHAIGSIPLDLEKLGAAWYTSNCHKWLCSPKSAAILYARPDKQHDIVPSVISHAGADNPDFVERFCWPGTWDPTPAICAADAIDYGETLLPGGWPEIMQKNHELVVEGRNLLCEMLGLERPCPDEMIVSMATLELPMPEHPTSFNFLGLDPLQNKIYEEYKLEGPLWYWGDPARRFLRISSQLYNSAEQYRFFSELLKKHLPNPNH